jgi:hypothetical protein
LLLPLKVTMSPETGLTKAMPLMAAVVRATASHCRRGLAGALALGESA